MSTKTNNLNLDKPELTDAVSKTIPQLASNFDLIDTSLAQNETKIEDVTKNPNYNNGAIVTIIDDDCRDAIKTIWQPVLDATGARISFACMTGVVGQTIGGATYLTKEELLALQAGGNEIISHTINGKDTSNITVDLAEIEYRDSQIWLKENGFYGYDTLVYPGGMSTERIDLKNIARKYYKYGVATIITGQPNIPPVDNWRVPRINGDSDTLDSLKTKVDKAVTDGSWMLIMTHSHVVDSQKMRDFITYVQSLNVPIMTFGEAQKYKGNVIAIGEYTDYNSTFIGANGNTKNSFNYLTKPDLGSTSTMDAPITDYPKNTNTKMTLNSVTDTNFHTGGVYEVFRSVDDLFSYATFTPWNSNKMFMRKWDLSNGVWKAFEPLSGYITGIWTPTLEGTTTVGTHIYSTQTGRYSQNGNIVTASFYIRINYADLDSNMAGNLRIGGLPFAFIGGNDRPAIQVEYNNLTLGTNYFNVIGEPNGTYIDFFKMGSGVATVNLPTTALTASQVIVFRGQVTYRTA